MKYILIFFLTIILFKPVFCQSITLNDSADVKYKIYEGEIKTNKFEGGYSSYILGVSKYHNFVEISSVYWQSISVKYRLEKIPGRHFFSIMKTMLHERDSVPICYIALDSNTVNKIKKGKRGFGDLKNEKLYKDLVEPERIVFSLFLKIIIQHNLQNEFLNYEPELFVAWLKVKG
jgi:hypothetical protein